MQSSCNLRHTYHPSRRLPLRVPLLTQTHSPGSCSCSCTLLYVWQCHVSGDAIQVAKSCIYFHTYRCTYIHTGVQEYMHTYIRTYASCIHTYTYMHAHTYIHIHTYKHTCIHTYTHTHTHIHTYMHTHTYISTHRYMHTYILPQRLWSTHGNANGQRSILPYAVNRAMIHDGVHAQWCVQAAMPKLPIMSVI